MNILNEALVFPKHKVLLECETLLDEVIKISRQSKVDVISLKKNVSLVEEKLADLFNFSALSLNFKGFSVLDAITGGNPYIGFGVANAFTYSKDPYSTFRHVISDNTEVIKKNAGHISWNSKEISPFASVTVLMGFVSIKDITGAEVLSVILHEIGHCFYKGSLFSNAWKVFASIVSFCGNMISILENGLVNIILPALAKDAMVRELIDWTYTAAYTIYGEYISILTKGQPTGRLLEKMGVAGEMWISIITGLKSATYLMQFLGLFGALMTNAGAVFKDIANAGGFAINKIKIAQFIGMDGLSEEKFSDEFAAMHGYGSDLAMAMNKMEGLVPWERGSDEPTITMALASANAWIGSLLAAGDVHPDYLGRPIFLLDFYKEQLKLAKNPKERKFIEGEILKLAKASSIYQLTSKAAKKDKILELTKTDTSTLLKKYALFDFLKDLVSSNSGSGANLTKDLEGTH